MNWLQKLCEEYDENAYFEIGHGDYSHEDGYLIWVLLDGQIKTSPHYSTQDRKNTSATHGSLWGHDVCDRTYKGRYEPQTGRISVVKPCGKERFPIPLWVLDALHERFYISELHEF